MWQSLVNQFEMQLQVISQVLSSQGVGSDGGGGGGVGDQSTDAGHRGFVTLKT